MAGIEQSCGTQKVLGATGGAQAVRHCLMMPMRRSSMAQATRWRSRSPALLLAWWSNTASWRTRRSSECWPLAHPVLSYIHSDVCQWRTAATRRAIDWGERAIRLRRIILFVMHPDDEMTLMAELLHDQTILLVDRPRWKSATPPTTRNISAVGYHCLIWS